MEAKNLSYLFAFIFATLFLSSMAADGNRKLLRKEQGLMEMHESIQQLQEDDELVVVHERILRQVKTTNDYGTYDPSPTMAKPHFKDIPN